MGSHESATPEVYSFVTDASQKNERELAADATTFEQLLDVLKTKNPNEIAELIRSGSLTQDEFDIVVDRILYNLEYIDPAKQRKIGREAIKAIDEVPIDAIVFPSAAREEVWNDAWDEPPILEVADMLPDNRVNLHFLRLERENCAEELRRAFSILRDRQLHALQRRMGDDENEPFIFAKIGDSLGGLSAPGAQSLYSTALNRVRLALGREWLKDRTLLSLISDSSHEVILKQQYTLREHLMTEAEIPVETEIVAPELPAIIEDESEKIYQEIIAQETYILFRQLMLKADPNNFKVAPVQAKQASYPRKIVSEIENQLGTNITPKTIERFWNSEGEQWIQILEQSLGDNLDFNKIGQFISALLRTRMQDSDSIRLRIPATSQNINYLGAEACRGEIIIEGDAGDFIGVHMTGTARIIVIGNAGKAAGAQAKGKAYLNITGNAGDFLAYCAGGEAAIIVEGFAGRRAALGVSQTPEIRINGRLAFLPDTQTDSVEKLIDFDDVCRRLDVDPDELEYYRHECRYPSKLRSFTEAEIECILEMFPELSASR